MGAELRRHAIRRGLVVVLTVGVCAVAAGARSFVAVAEWVADLPAALADMLGTNSRCPSESTIRRVVRDIDADPLDRLIGAFVQQLCAAVAPAGRRRLRAEDGKTLRGSRHTDHDGNVVAAPGVDRQTLADFEKDLKSNLYKIWNRMSSESYFPLPVRAVEIPRPHGGEPRCSECPPSRTGVGRTGNLCTRAAVTGRRFSE